MTTNVFESLSQEALAAFIKAAKNEVFLCLPSIQEELAHSIVELLKERKSDLEQRIHILLDFDSQPIRQGYGDLEAVRILTSSGIQIHNLKDIRISFVIIDDLGYFLFYESRSILPADKLTLNAVKIDQINQIRLKAHFFKNIPATGIQAALNEALVEQSKNLEEESTQLLNNAAAIQIVNDEEKNRLIADLELNPPINPDYKRLVEVYSSKFQYVKLSFEGVNIKRRRIEIPNQALPIADAKLKEKLQTKLKLFDKQQDVTFPELEELSAKVAQLRTDFLKKIKSRDESLLEKTKKNDFISQMEIIKGQFESAKEKIEYALDEQISKTRFQLKNDLNDFFMANPQSLSPQLNEYNPSRLKIAVEDKVGRLVYSINWPEAKDLLQKIDLKANYSDITIEDLQSETFRNELLEIELITQEDLDTLVEFTTTLGLNSAKS